MATQSVVVMMLTVAVACGGRIVDVPKDSGSDAVSDAGLGPAFKVAYQGQGSVMVWHSRDASIEAFSANTIGTFTYDGHFMSVVDGASVEVLNADASLHSSQSAPTSIGAPVTLASPRPDALRLVVYARTTGDAALFGTLDPSGAYHELVNEQYAGAPTYSPDGKAIVFRTSVKNGSTLEDEIVLMNDDGSGRTVLVSSGAGPAVSDPSFSFDGKRVAYSLDTGIAFIDIASRTVSVLVGVHLGRIDRQPRFTPDGTAVVFVEVRENVASLMSVDVATQNVTTLVDAVSAGFLPDVVTSLSSDN